MFYSVAGSSQNDYFLWGKKNNVTITKRLNPAFSTDDTRTALNSVWVCMTQLFSDLMLKLTHTTVC